MADSIVYGAEIDPTYVYRAETGGTVFTALQGNLSVFDYFDDAAVVDDALYIGTNLGGHVSPTYINRRPTRDIKFYVGTALAADAITLVWEYSAHSHWNNPSCWKTLTVVDGTVDFTRTGEQWVRFHVPLDHCIVGTQRPAGVSSAYYIRCRITAITNVTEGGAQSTQDVQVRRTEMQVTDYSVAACTFDDLHTADLAGTLVLAPALPCTAAMACLTPKAAEQVALRLDFILSGTSAGAGDTIDITGTGADDGAQTESIDVSGGDATYTSTYAYKTITSFDCTGWADGTVEVQQGRWGAIGKFGAQKVYQLWGYITIEASSYFADTKCAVVSFFPACDGGIIRIIPYGNLTLGTLASGYGIDGCQFYWKYSNIVTYTGNRIISARLKATAVKEYGCAFDGGGHDVRGSTMDAYDCKFETYLSYGAALNIQRCTMTSWILQFPGHDATIENIWVVGSGGDLLPYGDATMRNVIVPDTLRPGGGTSGNQYAINCQAGTWGNVSPNATLYRQYTYDLQVVDRNGAPIENVTVVMKDKDDAQLFSLTTDANGDITQQDISYIIYTYSGGLVTDERTPHTVTLSKAGYITKTIISDIDQQRIDVEVLQAKRVRKDITGNLFAEINASGDLLRVS